MEYPRRSRGVAATPSPRNIHVAAAASPRPRLHGMSTSRPRRRRDSSRRNFCDLSPRNIRVAPRGGAAIRPGDRPDQAVGAGVAQRYGEGKAQQCFLLFDGVHYDPCVLAAAPGTADHPADQTLCGADDAGAIGAVEALAASDRAARKFTDTSSFALQCLVCGTGLKGTGDAEAHAAATGHMNFSQVGH